MAEKVLDVARKGMGAYARGDYDTFLSLLADDVAYALYLDPADLPFAGETHGKGPFMERVAEMHAAYEYVLFRPFKFRGRGSTVHNQVEFIYRHKASGHVLDGRFRCVVTVRDGLISRIEEYHDAARVKAFLRLTGGGSGA